METRQFDKSVRDIIRQAAINGVITGFQKRKEIESVLKYEHVMEDVRAFEKISHKIADELMEDLRL